jgi:cell division protein ZapD
VITYEYPLNERIRTLLRLEDLFDKLAYFMPLDGSHEHHVALLTLFGVLEVCSRADLKMDLIQELERQRQTLLVFRNNPEISEEALSGALYEIEQSSAALLGMTGKMGQYLRENDWLMSIKSRAMIPGGVCEFDLPSYHFWLHHAPDYRREAFAEWVKPLQPLRDGLTIVLRLLRASGRAEQKVAPGGAFQLMLGGTGTGTGTGNGAGAAQMVRIMLKLHDPFVPEISANKYALNIRFTRPEIEARARQCEGDVAFEMVFCTL